MKKRIFVTGFKQESNSFCPLPTEFDAFAAGYREGDSLIHSNGQAGETISGIIDVLDGRGAEIIGGVCMSAVSGGPVRHSVIDDYLRRTLELLRGSGPIDGVLLSLHGATLSDRSDDVCGDILAAFRGELGEEIPIAAACDLHANITPKMLENADILCGYQTYPHVDFYETGERTADLLLRKIAGEPLKMAAAFIPMMASASGYTTLGGKLASLMGQGQNLVNAGRIIDFSLFQVQPWLDIPVIASCALVIAHSEEDAKRTANGLAERNFALREEIQYKDQYTVEDVVKAALQCSLGETVILVDSADSAGAGSCSDSAVPLSYILPYRKELQTAISVTDPEAAEQAFRLGVGGKGDFELGGKLAPMLSSPVLVKDAVVKSLHTGEFINQGPANRGQKWFIGKTAVLQADEIQILVSSKHASQRDIQFFRGFGIEPSVCRLVCVKANTSFIAGYSSVNARIYKTSTPGSACPVLQDLPYKKIPQPFYPFQEIHMEDIVPARCYRN